MLKRIALAFPAIRRVQEDRIRLRDTVASLSKTVASLSKQLSELTDRDSKQQVEMRREFDVLWQAIASPSITKDNLYIPSEVFAGSIDEGYLVSSIPTTVDFMNPEFRKLIEEIKIPFGFYRKAWEFAYVFHKLKYAGVIHPGSRGLGFGVGLEALPALFAKYGCHIVATDAPLAIVNGQWIETDQHSNDVSKLARPDIVDNETFFERVTFEECDMNGIGDHLTDFDFCWSTCSLEHLGSLQHGLDFIVNSVEKTLKLGGVACHTTELNLSSDEETMETKDLSLYRRKDWLGLIERLRERGHEASPMVISPGATPIDYYVDLPPYSHNPHLKLQLDKFVTTSVGIVVRRGR